jgi:hypothetical protein
VPPQTLNRPRDPRAGEAPEVPQGAKVGQKSEGAPHDVAVAGVKHHRIDRKGDLPVEDETRSTGLSDVRGAEGDGSCNAKHPAWLSSKDTGREHSGQALAWEFLVALSTHGSVVVTSTLSGVMA